MNTRFLTSRAIAATLATALALSASVAFAEERSNRMSDDGGDDSQKTVICEAIGCNNGALLCGAVYWHTWVWFWTPFGSVPWRFTESVTCYEPHQEA